MSEVNISQIHLSFIRGFRYYPTDETLKEEFSYLNDKRKYYDNVIKDNSEPGKRFSKSIVGLGMLRSVLDTQSASIDSSNFSNPRKSDSFFNKFRGYYEQLAEDNQILVPHYPCVVDVLPSSASKYRINLSSLPGSLSKAETARASLSIRVYPAGLAFLRLGIFLSTTKSFEVDDIVGFLRYKNGLIDIEGLGTDLNIGRVTEQYAKRLFEGLHNQSKDLDFMDYSIVDIVKSSPLTVKGASKEVFKPLLCWSRGASVRGYKVNNVAKEDGDIQLIGPMSAVTCIQDRPGMNLRMNGDRRKIRRGIRNSVELFFLQKYLAEYIETKEVSSGLNQAQNDNYLKFLKKGILPPNIEQLLSCWNYTCLHIQNTPIVDADWKTRYNELLLTLDKEKQIETAQGKAIQQLLAVKDEVSAARKECGKIVEKAISYVSKFLPPPYNALLSADALSLNK